MDKKKIEQAIKDKAHELRAKCEETMLLRLFDLDLRGEIEGAQNDLDWFSGRFKGLQIVLKNLDGGYLDSEEDAIARVREV